MALAKNFNTQPWKGYVHAGREPDVADRSREPFGGMELADPTRSLTRVNMSGNIGSTMMEGIETQITPVEQDEVADATETGRSTATVNVGDHL